MWDDDSPSQVGPRGGMFRGTRCLDHKGIPRRFYRLRMIITWRRVVYRNRRVISKTFSRSSQIYSIDELFELEGLQTRWLFWYIEIDPHMGSDERPLGLESHGYLELIKLFSYIRSQKQVSCSFYYCSSTLSRSKLSKEDGWYLHAVVDLNVKPPQLSNSHSR